MPDLNLQEDEGAQENVEGSMDVSSEGEGVETTQESAEGKGGLVKIIIIVAGILILGGGGVFLLNSLGIVKIWGKKAQPTVVQMEESDPSEEANQEQTGATQLDTTQPQPIETPAIEEPKTVVTKPEAKAATKAPPKKEAPVKTMPPAVGTKLGEMKGEFTIQVSAWRNKETAEEMVNRLSEAGYAVYLEERSYKGGTWFTVRIGRYGSRKDAQAAVESFAEELRSRYWIDRASNK